MSTFTVDVAGAVSPVGSLNIGRIEIKPGVFVAGLTPINFTRKYSIATTLDGVTWTLRTSPLDYTGSNEHVNAVATDGNSVVAVGGSNTTSSRPRIMRSTDDGATWAGVTSPWSSTGSSSSEVFGIWYSPERSLWMAVGHRNGTGSPLAATSPDGITWTACFVDGIGSHTELPKTPRFVTYQNGAWWMGGSGGSGGWHTLAKSTDDGATWTAVANQWFENTSTAGKMDKLIYGNSLYVAVGFQGTSLRNFTIQTSPDGTTWTTRANPFDRQSGQPSGGEVFDVVWVSALSLFVAGGLNQPASGDVTICTSPDGITWTKRTTALQSWRAFAYAADLAKLVVVGTNASVTVATSPDGITWTSQGDPTTGEGFNGLAYIPPPGPPDYIVNEHGATSPAGTLSVERIPSIGSWVQKASPPLAQVTSGMAAHGGKLYVFGGRNQSTGATLNKCQCYDPATDSWSSKANMTAAMSDVRAITIGDDIWLFGNPDSGSRAWIYHPLTNTYSATAAQIGVLMNHLQAQTVVYIPDNGGLWALQDNAFPSFENSHLRADPANQTAGWVATGPYRPGGFQNNSPATSTGSKAYHLSGGPTFSAHSYDAVTNTWTAIASPTIGRQSGQAVVYHGEVWLVGGYDNASFSSIRKVELYDPDTNTWRLGPYDLSTRNLNAVEVLDIFHPIYAFRDSRLDTLLSAQVTFELFLPAPVELETEIVVDVDLYPFPWLQSAIEVDVDTEDNLLTVPHARALVPGFIHTGEEV